MKKKYILLYVLFFAACNITGPSSTGSIQPGTYEGSFSITYFAGTDSAATVISQTTFTFNDTGWYTCRGNLIYTPPVGGGEYKIINGLLCLKDLVPHTAEFDWSLILNGYFEITISGISLTLTQDDKTRSRYRYIVLKRVSSI
jgi:hypothetical protein